MSTELRAKAIAAGVAGEVRAELARQRISQQQLADRLGVNQWWVSRRLRPESAAPISAAELLLMSEALDVPVSQFLPLPVGAAR